MTGREQEYDHYDDPNNGDMQIIVPNKLLLFKVPVTGPASWRLM